ncbi:MAG: PQQ-binding-like beta-propeller repeat protein [Ignavibacteriales bacterium]|nr:PQQ-binding-like beta-propeller repeat protein [Ignavibacteriales bacterium]
MKNKYLLVLSLLISSAVYAQIQKSSSTPISFLSDNNHSSVYNETPVVSAPEAKYFYKTGGSIRSTPAVFQNKLFFGSGDKNFYCLDENSGNLLWKFKTGGAITSSPAISNNKIYFASKDGFLYCLKYLDGNELWKINLGNELPYKWEFDYYLSSPTIYNGVVYIGSGDGNLYAVNSESGKLLWKFFVGSRVRSTPAVANGILYFGDMAGKLYALDLKSQKPKWIFETSGATIKIEDFGFDRAAFISSPTIHENYILIGSREGCLYCVDMETGKLNWKDDQKMSWVISTPTIFNENAIVGTSDGHFVKSLNIKTGTEIWRFKTATPVWTSIAVAGNVAYGGDYSGNFFALNVETGIKLWEFKTDDRIHSSPIIHNGVIYFGSDDGYLYAIKGSPKNSDRLQKSKKAVYWEESKGFNWFQNRSDEIIKDFFVKEGYELVDGNKIKLFMEERLKDKLPSAIIFARNDFPTSIHNDSTKSDLLREYLKGDNKVVLLGENPLAYIKNKDGVVTEVDYRKATKYFGIEYGGELTDAMKGLIPCYVTEDGIKAGLKGFWIPMAAVTPDQVTTVYAKDENGFAASWLKNYGGPKNSGLVQLWVNRQLPVSLPMIKNAVEFGMQ